MGKRDWEIKKLTEQTEERFFNIRTGNFENPELLLVRKEIWAWMVKCIEGPEKEKLFCYHVLRETDKWDIFSLFKNVKEFLHTENYKMYGQKLEKFYSSSPKQNEDIFSYISRIDQMVEDLEKLQYLAVEAGETLKIPKFNITWKIVSAVEKFPEFRTFTEKIQQMEPKEWIRLDVNDIRTELHKIHINKKDGDTKETSVFYAPTPHTEGPAPSSSEQHSTEQLHTTTTTDSHSTKIYNHRKTPTLPVSPRCVFGILPTWCVSKTEQGATLHIFPYTNSWGGVWDWGGETKCVPQ